MLGAPPGGRANPTWQPVPNAEPAGANTGAPPRTQFYSRMIAPSGPSGATLIVAGTPENRFISITPPSNSFTIYIGDAGVTPATGLALPKGQPYTAAIPGLQDIYAVTDAPSFQRVGVQVSIVLAAEQQRKTGGL